MADEKTIHEAIAAIYGDVGYVQKERGQGLNYSFASEKALIEAIRPHMTARAVYVSVPSVHDVRYDSYPTRNGGEMQVCRLVATVRFTHAPSATHIDVMSIGEGADVGDKSANKAMTAAYKYALRQTFCIETGDDPDYQQPAEREHRTPARRESGPEAPQAAPPPVDAAPGGDGSDDLKRAYWKVFSDAIVKGYEDNGQQVRPGWPEVEALIGGKSADALWDWLNAVPGRDVGLALGEIAARRRDQARR